MISRQEAAAVMVDGGTKILLEKYTKGRRGGHRRARISLL
jgi:hypothetical protein